MKQVKLVVIRDLKGKTKKVMHAFPAFEVVRQLKIFGAHCSL